MTIETKDFSFQVKDVEPTGVFEGYLSVFGNIDQGNEVVAPGAFTESLRAVEAKGDRIPILWQHRSGEPIGYYDHLREDNYGLNVKGVLLVSEIQRAREAHALLKARAMSGQSIGYEVKADSVDSKTRVRTLHKLTLHEGSLVTFPMNDLARVNAVKSISRLLKAGDLPSLAEFEDFLCEAGFSRSQAKAVAGHGLRKLVHRCEADGQADEALKALRAFSLT